MQLNILYVVNFCLIFWLFCFVKRSIYFSIHKPILNRFWDCGNVLSAPLPAWIRCFGHFLLGKYLQVVGCRNLCRFLFKDTMEGYIAKLQISNSFQFQQMIGEIWIGSIFRIQMLVGRLFSKNAGGLVMSKWSNLSQGMVKQWNILQCWNAEMLPC